jgi:hypothetical protein
VIGRDVASDAISNHRNRFPIEIDVLRDSIGRKVTFVQQLSVHRIHAIDHSKVRSNTSVDAMVDFDSVFVRYCLYSLSQLAMRNLQKVATVLRDKFAFGTTRHQ